MATKSQIIANNKYNAKTYTKITVNVPKQTAELFNDFCNKQGKTKNGILNEWIKKAVADDEG